MNPFAAPGKIVISTCPHDMRAGIQRLAQIVTADFGLDPADGSPYIFASRTADKLKMLRFETNGWCMYCVRLCEGTFKWAHTEKSDDPLPTIERRGLTRLLEGLPTSQPEAPEPLAATAIL